MPKLSKHYAEHLLGCHSMDKSFYGIMFLTTELTFNQNMGHANRHTATQSGIHYPWNIRPFTIHVSDMKHRNDDVLLPSCPTTSAQEISHPTIC